MLKVINISTGYGKKQVLFDVSFEVKEGEIVLLVGSNGSGKSTLLKAVYGILSQWYNGQVFFSGGNITGIATSELLKRGLLYIPQKNNLFEDLTVKENLEMAGLTIDQKLLRHRIENSLSIFSSLLPQLHRIPMKLSGGERQLLTFAMATLHQPKMLLIDEPFNGLSPYNITFVSENLRMLNQRNGITLLIVEHHIKESLQVANKVIGMKLGKLVSETIVNQNFNVSQLQDVFV
jgi:branched-chain amino acid transport system ATP-binding protein